MLAIERKKKIMSLLQENNSVLVPELSKYFGVTEETIRRDLEKLEKEGLLIRTYGGAILNESNNVDVPLTIREGTNIRGKQSIGIKVADYIENGDTIMLDSSSTALQVAKAIKTKKNLTVITNSVKIVMELADAKECKVISTGGMLRNSSLSFVGYVTEKLIESYNVNKAIIGCKGIDIDKGITESNEMEAHVKNAMADQSKEVILVVDHSKFDRVSFIKIINFDKIDIIFTDNKLSEEWEQYISKNNIKLIYS